MNPITSQILEELTRAGVQLTDKVRSELETRFDTRFGDQRETKRAAGESADDTPREDNDSVEAGHHPSFADLLTEWTRSPDWLPGEWPFLRSTDGADGLAHEIGPHTPDFARLRVGLLTDAYLPFSNGVTHMVALMAKALAARGHEPHVFTFAAPGAVRASLENHDGVFVHHAPAIPVSKTGYHFATRYPLRIRRILRQMDVLHAHHPFISGRIAWRFKRPEQPLVFTNHTRYDIYGHYLQQWLPFLHEDQVQEILTHRAARLANRCDRVISPSQSVAYLLRDWGVTAPIQTVPNGIELKRFHDAAAAASPEFDRTFRARWNWPESAKVIVYLGRLVPEKNVDRLLEAFAAALRSIPDARLLLIGDGPLNAELKALARSLQLGDRVRFAGTMEYSEVPRALAACDLFASASVSEVHPLTFIEAMASGVPALGTRSPGVADTLRDDESENSVAPNGFLCTVDKFGEVLIKALQNEAERKKRAAQALEDSRAYSIDATIDATLELYKDVLTLRQAAAAR